MKRNPLSWLRNEHFVKGKTLHVRSHVENETWIKLDADAESIEWLSRLPISKKSGLVTIYFRSHGSKGQSVSPRPTIFIHEDYLSEFGHISKEGHLRLPRYIMNVWDRNLVVDHINGDTRDNRKSNLRVATHSQNCVNRESVGFYRRRPDSKVFFMNIGSKWVKTPRHKTMFISMNVTNNRRTAKKAVDLCKWILCGEACIGQVKRNWTGLDREIETKVRTRIAERLAEVETWEPEHLEIMARLAA